MANYAVKLTFETPQRIKFKGRDVFRVRVTASDAVDMPNEIFLVRETLVDPDDPLAELKLEFQSVCSVYDLSIYPANSPNPNQTPPFFRVVQVDIPTPGIEVAADVIEKLKTYVAQLIKQQNQLDDLSEVEEVWIPSEPTDPTTTTTTTAP